MLLTFMIETIHLYCISYVTDERKCVGVNVWDVNLFVFQSYNSSWLAGSVQSSLVKVAQDQSDWDLLGGVWEEMQIVIQKQTAAGQEKWEAAMNH